MSFLSRYRHLPLFFCLCVCFPYMSSLHLLLIYVSLPPLFSNEQQVDMVVAGLEEGASSEGEGHQLESVTDVTVTGQEPGENVPVSVGVPVCQRSVIRLPTGVMRQSRPPITNFRLPVSTFVYNSATGERVCCSWKQPSIVLYHSCHVSLGLTSVIYRAREILPKLLQQLNPTELPV